MDFDTDLDEIILADNGFFGIFREPTASYSLHLVFETLDITQQRLVDQLGSFRGCRRLGGSQEPTNPTQAHSTPSSES